MQFDSAAQQDFRNLLTMVVAQDKEAILSWIAEATAFDPFYAIWISDLVTEMCDIVEIDMTITTLEHCAQARDYLSTIAKQ